MCYERYKGYTICAHAESPTKSVQCKKRQLTGRCTQGKEYVLIVEESEPTLCPGCRELVYRLVDAMGSHNDEDSATWRLYYRIGLPHKEAALMYDITWACERLRHMMNRWEGPRHNYQAIIAKWIAIFDEFKEWLCERLEKRDARGRLYFPPGEATGARMEKKKVLQHLVRWTLANMAQGQFDMLDIAVFRKGLNMAFTNLIYEWDTHFPEEPGYHFAEHEFNTYWTSWFRKRDRASLGARGGRESDSLSQCRRWEQSIGRRRV